jgi:hypothetical protein
VKDHSSRPAWAWFKTPSPKITRAKWTGSAGHWWLTPITLATQEAQIRKIAVQSQPRQIVHEILS